METFGSELEVAVPPLRRAAAADSHRSCDMGDRAASFDSAAQKETTLRGQRGVTVNHKTSVER